MKTNRFQYPALREFAEQQARFAPVPVRVAQMERAERLLPILKPDESYAYRVLIHTITSRPTEQYPGLMISGAVATRDLLLFIEHISDSLNLDATAATESVLTQDELSRKYNVAVKTISRWRARGLGGRRYRFGNRKRLAFPQSLVERFVAENQQAVEYGARFNHLTDDEREWAIRRARRLVRWGANQTQIVRRLAKRLGRSPEALRYTLKQHDMKYPTVAVFPDSKVAITEQDKREIYLALKRGDSPTEVAKTYRRTRSSIHRIAKEYRREQFLKLPLEYFDCAAFHAENADEVLLTPSAELSVPELEPVEAGTLQQGYFADLHAFPVLTKEQEFFLFRKMNYLQFKAVEARSQLPRSQPDVASLDAIDALLEAAQSVKNILIRCNLRLVVSVARKHQHDESSFFDLISDGNMVVIRSIEKFNFTLGHKFSTYATWSLMRHYARYLAVEAKRGNRYRRADEASLNVLADQTVTVAARSEELNHQHAQLNTILNQLDEREQEAVSLRFGLGSHLTPLSLEEIGTKLGLTKERARQVLASAMTKLREFVSLDDAWGGALEFQ